MTIEQVYLKKAELDGTNSVEHQGSIVEGMPRISVASSPNYPAIIRQGGRVFEQDYPSWQMIRVER